MKFHKTLSVNDNAALSRADWPDLLKSIYAFSGSRMWFTFGIVAVASFVEGLGLVMLLPMAGILFAQTRPDSGVAARFSDILESFGPEGTLAQLILLSVIFLIWMALRGVFLVYRDRRLVRLTHGYVDHLRIKMFSSFASASWPAVRRLPKAEMFNALTVDLRRVAVAVNFLAKLAITATLSVSYLIVSFTINFAIGLSLLGLAIVACAVAVIWSRNSGVLGRSLTKGNKKDAFVTTTFLDGLKSAKAYHAEDVFIQEYAATIGSLRGIQTAFVMQQGRLRRGVEMFGAIASVGILLVGFGVIGIAGAELAVLVVVVVRLTPSLLQSLAGFQSVAFAMPAFVSAQRRMKLMEKQAVGQADGRRCISGPFMLEPAGITLSNAVVELDEAGEGNVLLRVDDLCLPATGLVHLAGRSGAGKSTFAELIAGLYLPDSGTVRAGELALSGDNLAAWQTRVAFAPQEPFLFNGTVLENLTWPNSKADTASVWHALAAAGADQLVRSLPDGLSQALQDGGSRLSGGERQRLCLARALLRPSAVLIIDEGLSAVEPDLEREILGRLKILGQEKLVLCVNHSPVIEALADATVKIGPQGTAHLV